MTVTETETIFGPIVTGADVEDWIFQVLQRWSCTYLAEVERQHGIEPGSLPDVRAWVPAPSFDFWPEDQVPGVLVVSTGTSERPLKSGDGSYRARWQIRLGVIVSAATQAQSHKLAKLYLAAHATILLQRPSLEGRANGVDWLGEEYTQIAFDDIRSIATGEALFTVQVDDVRHADAGPVTPADPRDPCTDPWPPWATATLVDVDVESTLDPLGEEES